MKFCLIVTLFLSVVLSAASAHSAPFDYHDFARIPVLHEGRIKPLDSFARIELKRIYGQSYLPAMPAIEWLAKALFTPASAMQQHIFLVRSHAVIQPLSLPPREDALYNFEELAAALGAHPDFIAAIARKSQKSLSANEQEFVALYNHVNDFAEIIGTFSLLMPLKTIAPQTREKLHVPPDALVTYLDIIKIRKGMDALLAKTIKQKRDQISQYTPDERINTQLLARIVLMENIDKTNSLVRIIPPFWEGSNEWLAPWAVIEKGYGSPQSSALFKQWQKLALSYQQADTAMFKKITHEIRIQTEPYQLRPMAISWEAYYNAFDLLNKSLLLYAAGLAGLLAAIIWRNNKVLLAAKFSIGLGAALHGAALMMRMIILLRPPVSTLYESMIFVSFVVAVAGLWMRNSKNSGEIVFISTFTASLLLLSASFFSSDNDTLGVLVAVLNTNFWLGTHVVCITTGYGCSLIAGAMAHLYLFKRTLPSTKPESLILLQDRLHKAALIALLFTTVGTMLGGIWADQSWGRFWGWDPKENGALLIVLWLIWVLHGRLAGQLRSLGFSVLMACTTVIVALAWVGVNLLSVGLHSYGFTDSTAFGLLAFCISECGFITAITTIIWLREKRDIPLHT